MPTRGLEFKHTLFVDTRVGVEYSGVAPPPAGNIAIGSFPIGAFPIGFGGSGSVGGILTIDTKFGSESTSYQIIDPRYSFESTAYKIIDRNLGIESWSTQVGDTSYKFESSLSQRLDFLDYIELISKMAKDSISPVESVSNMLGDSNIIIDITKSVRADPFSLLENVSRGYRDLFKPIEESGAVLRTVDSNILFEIISRCIIDSNILIDNSVTNVKRDLLINLDFNISETRDNLARLEWGYAELQDSFIGIEYSTRGVADESVGLDYSVSTISRDLLINLESTALNLLDNFIVSEYFSNLIKDNTVILDIVSQGLIHSLVEAENNISVRSHVLTNIEELGGRIRRVPIRLEHVQGTIVQLNHSLISMDTGYSIIIDIEDLIETLASPMVIDPSELFQFEFHGIPFRVLLQERGRLTQTAGKIRISVRRARK